MRRLFRPKSLENPILAEINSKTPSYQPNWNLLSKLDQEWIGYVNGKNGFYYKWLAVAVSVMKPRNILELGTCTGTRAIMMYAEMQEDATLTSVDIARDHRFIPEPMKQDSRVKFVIGNDLDLKIYGDRLPEGIDFLFVDTEHRAEQAQREWDLYCQRLRNGALVAFDDIRLNDMPRFWQSIRREKFDLTRLCHYPSGFGVLFYSCQ